MSVDLRHFRSFVAVAEEGNIGRAAQRLFITQPALSRQMQQLERSVGSTLLLRSAHGVELTEDGREMLVRARRTLEAAEQAMAVGHDEPSGPLTLGLPMAGSRDDWYSLCEAFADDHPRVEVDVHVALSESLQRQVVSGELDCALALAPARLPALSYDVVRVERLSVWMNRDHPLSGRSELSLDDLDGQTITLVGGAAGAGSGFNAVVRGLFDGIAARPEFAQTTDVFPARAVSDPSYLGISPPLDFPGEVVGVPLEPCHTMAYEFVHRAGTDRAAVRAFGAFAREHFAAAARQPCPARMLSS